MFVAPPQAGVVEGPSRGMELGGMSVTFPELTLRMPKFRFNGVTHTHRQARMRLDEATAPFVAQQAVAPTMPFGAFPPTQAPPPPPAQTPAPPCDSKKSCCPGDGQSADSRNTEQRLRVLEDAVERQLQEVTACIELMKKTHTVERTIDRNDETPRDELPWPTPDDSTSRRTRRRGEGESPKVTNPLSQAHYVEPNRTNQRSAITRLPRVSD